MKKFIAVLVILCGCSNSVDDNGETLIDYGVQMVQVGGCQYVIAKTYKGVAMVHAANCGNSFHRK